MNGRDDRIRDRSLKDRTVRAVFEEAIGLMSSTGERIGVGIGSCVSEGEA